jgi:broad specificity phosphatase PhoE
MLGTLTRRFVSIRLPDPASMGVLNMPMDLVLVRHATAEGNLAFRASRKGDHQFFTPSFMELHESRWRLTAAGRKEAMITGKWIQEHISSHFDRYLCSEYVRALETAALLGLPNSHWERAVFLRERNFGRLSSLSYRERDRRFADALKLRQLDAFYWTPPSGESLANVSLRVDYVLDSLAEFDEPLQSAIVVTHIHVIQVFRSRLEMIGQRDFERELINVERKHKIMNGSLIHYTRRDPVSKEVAPVYKWKRFWFPWHDRADAPVWEDIQYKYLTNEDLLKEIDT